MFATERGDPLDALVAFSHGGNVACYAMAFQATSGIRLHRLVTLGTPVRSDLETFYRAARPAIGRWVHVYGGSDWWAVLGTLGDRCLRVLRAMPEADVNRFVEGAQHGELVRSELVLEMPG